MVSHIFLWLLDSLKTFRNPSMMESKFIAWKLWTGVVLATGNLFTDFSCSLYAGKSFKGILFLRTASLWFFCWRVLTEHPTTKSRIVPPGRRAQAIAWWGTQWATTLFRCYIFLNCPLDLLLLSVNSLWFLIKTGVSIGYEVAKLYWVHRFFTSFDVVRQALVL